MSPLLRACVLSIAVVIIVISGILLTRSEYPPNAFILAVHKLLSLALVIVFGVDVYHSSGLSVPYISFIVVAAVLFISSFVTGGITAASLAAPSWVLWTHRIGAWFAVAAMAVFIWRSVKF